MSPEHYRLMFEAQGLLRLQGASEDVVKNAFFANYLAALVLLKLQDLKGLMLINDHSNSKLTRFSNSSSDLNFWGRALFYSKEAEVKHRMLPGHAELLAQDAGRVTTARIMSTMQVPLTAPEKINWHDVVAALILYRERFSISSSYYAKTTLALSRWDSLNDNGRKKVVNDCFMYLLQSDPKSALTPRMRALSNSVMINTLDTLAMRFVGFKKLHEDEGGGTAVGNIGSSQSSSNGIISPPGFEKSCSSDDFLGNQYKLNKMSPRQVTKKSGVVIKDGKIIKKKVKGFKPRKFKAPDFLRATSTKKESENAE